MHTCMQNIEETIAKYAVYFYLFWLGSTNPKKNIPWIFLVGGAAKYSTFLSVDKLSVDIMSHNRTAQW